MPSVRPLAWLAAAALLAAAAPPSTLPPNIAAAAADPARADQVAKDATRHGPEILAFAGVAPGMKVIDLIPGGGYWTRLFAKSVGPKGHVYAVWPIEYAKEAGSEPAGSKALAARPDYGNVTVLDQPAVGLAAPEAVDLVFTAQNYHDYPDKFMGAIDPAVLNRAVFKVLKKGGVYLIVDHVAEAGSGMRDTDTRHRIDPAIVKAQVIAAGFRFEGASAILANPADDHLKPVFDPVVKGHTDQFVFKFRKP